MESDVLVRCDGVGKKFCRDLKKSLWYGVKDIAADFLPNGRAEEDLLNDDGVGTSVGLRTGEFWAVHDVSFELRRGECLGLIGRNGAGKTTLLKMLNGIIKPDCGRIELNGRVGALIALGAGFSPVLTGRENIYVNGSILGLKKSVIREKFDEIVDFAEIEDFIDSPVRTYSSGMSIRLGFSIAAVLIQPEILLLDEVLAVGDIGFTVKCLNAVRSFLDRSAVIFVSHNMQLVAQFTSAILLMKDGHRQFFTDDVAGGIERYMDEFPTTIHTSGVGLARVLDTTLASIDCEGRLSRITNNELEKMVAISISIQFEVDSSIQRAGVVVTLIDQSTRPVATFPVHDESDAPAFFSSGAQTITLDLGEIPLAPGGYSFIVAIYDPDSHNRTLSRIEGLAQFRVKSSSIQELVVWSPLRRPVQPRA